MVVYYHSVHMDLVRSIELEPVEPVGIFTEIKANDSRNNKLRIDKVILLCVNPAHKLKFAERSCTETGTAKPIKLSGVDSPKRFLFVKDIYLSVLKAKLI